MAYAAAWPTKAGGDGCCTWGRAWATAWPTCTTPSARARRSVNIVGDHATYHVQYDAPLTSDVEGVARPMSHWVKRGMSAESMSADAAEAIAVARRHPGNIATLILPANSAWTELPADTAVAKVVDEAVPHTTIEAVRAAAKAIRSGETTTLLLGSTALRERALKAAGRIARATGVRLLSETSNRRIERGGDRTPVDRLPYPIDLAVAKLKDVRHLVLVGAKAPVGFFAYPGKPSLLAPEDCEKIVLATVEQDLAHALEWLADELGIAADARKFTPHVTLARLRNSSPADVAKYLSARGNFQTAPFRVGRFVLMSSRDSVGGGPYVIEEAWPLTGADARPAAAPAAATPAKPQDRMVVDARELGPLQADPGLLHDILGLGDAAQQTVGDAEQTRT